MKKQRFFYAILIILFFITSCGPTNVKTESGSDLPKVFVNLYKVLDTLDYFYFQSKDLVHEADREGYLDSEDKDKIISAAKKYKKLHTNAVDLVGEWYNQIEKGKKTTAKDLLIEKMFELLESGSFWDKIVEETTGGEITLPTRLFPNLVELTKVLTSAAEN